MPSTSWSPTSPSRRTRLAPAPESGRPRGAAPSRAARIATFLLLLGGGLALLLLAMRLTAAAFSCDFSPLTSLPFGRDHAALAWLSAGLLAVLVVLVWLVLRDAREELWLPGERGGVLVSAAALERLAEEAAACDPDVVRAEADLSVRGGTLRGRVRVYGRPLGDAERLAGSVGASVRGALAAAVGAAAVDVRVKPRVLTVHQLARYLP